MNIKKLKAFTLVEVLIVIIIIGILIAALLPRLTGAQDRARAVAVQQQMAQVTNGVALLVTEGGSVTTPGTTPGALCLTNTAAIANSAGTLARTLNTLPRASDQVNIGAALAECPAGEYAVLFFDGASGMVVTETSDESLANATIPDAATLADVDTKAEIDALILADTATTGTHYVTFFQG